jgi:hypothetical protein
VRSCNTALVQMWRSVQNVYCYLRCTFLYFLTSVRFFCRLRDRSWSNRRFFSGILHYDLQKSDFHYLGYVFCSFDLKPDSLFCVCVCLQHQEIVKGEGTRKGWNPLLEERWTWLQDPSGSHWRWSHATLFKQWFLVGGVCWLHKAARV